MKEVVLNSRTKIYPDEVLYCEADQNYTRIYYKHKMVIVPLTLKILEESLTNFPFYRIHRSHLVNIDYIKVKLNRYEIEMWDRRVLIISRRNATRIESLLKKE